MAHTPGPWEAEPGAAKGAWIKGSNGEWAALACGDSHETAADNALLIAAAPELLDALQEVAACTLTPSYGWNISRINKARTLINAAIAKATAG